MITLKSIFSLPLFAAIVIFAASADLKAQAPETADHGNFGQLQTEVVRDPQKHREVSALEKPINVMEDENPVNNRNNGWYFRPNKEKRFKRYLNSVVGPVAIGRYSMVSGILTARNAPKEWGGKWEGFGKRFASNLGESAIKNTTQFTLDEALKVDSNFYLSRNRSVAARARNSVFSSVTSRNRAGKRVFGTPKIAGNLVSNVISAETWYPSRYDYKHGLKGAAISTAVDAGINLFREFVLKN